MENDKDYVPTYEYAKIVKRPIGAIYRWLRENKFKDGDVKRIKKQVDRILIKKTAKPLFYKDKQAVDN